ncbi:hypothetical protein BpHYR1_012132, partial [Brachionus plicatilis]
YVIKDRSFHSITYLEVNSFVIKRSMLKFLSLKLIIFNNINIICVEFLKFFLKFHKNSIKMISK